MNHKRKRPRSRRSGCHMCKWYKLNSFKDTRAAMKPADRREQDRLDDSVAEWKES